ncbi:hypothetical protein ACA910_020614 [Epithemia clementina (nom. ined.)]
MEISSKEGDDVKTDKKTNDKIVATPAFPEENPHNFGPASARDATMFTCERPGGDPADQGSKIPTQRVVDQWVQFMSSPERQIQHVIILLSDRELEAYEPPGLIAAYQAAGITVHHIPMSVQDSYQSIMETIDEIESKHERVVAHCARGIERSGRVAAGWIVHKYGLSPEQATEESLEAARQHKVERVGAAGRLKEWISAATTEDH